MKKIVLIFSFIFCESYLQAQNVNFEWVAQLGGLIYEKGRSLTLDASGNVYSAGEFGGTVDFDPGPGVVALTTVNGSGFVSKLDKNRNFIWAKQVDGTLVRPKSVKIDASGSVIIVGSYFLAIDLDPGPAVVSGSSTDIFFIIKLDALGNFILGKTFGHSDEPNNRCNLALDPVGNIYISSVYDYLSDFDPGPASYTLPIVGFEDIFILKLDQNANFVWAKGVGSNSLYNDESNAIAVDANGNVFITGIFGFGCDFDPGPGVFMINSPGVTPYVLKLNINGAFVWAKHFAPVTSNSLGNAKGLAVDQIGNVFVGGDFEGGTLDFDPGPVIYPMTTIAYYDAFLCKLDPSGNFAWAKSIGGSFQDLINSLTLDEGGNVYATGNFYNTVDFDPGVGINNQTSAGQNDVFILKLNTQGGFEWAKKVGGPGVDQGVSITLDAAGSVYTLGSFEGMADMDPDLGVVNLTTLGFEDIFLLKLSRCTNNTSSTITATACSVYTLNGQTYTATGMYTQTLINTAGCDSIITLNLTINNRYTILNAAACDSYTWNGQTYTSSGIYKDTISLANGCDSIITLNLVINSGIFSTINAAICSGQIYAGHTSTGIYIDTLAAANGCDSIRTLNLTVKPRSFSKIDTAICSGQNYGGHTTAGTYIDIFIAANGCDSVRTLNLSIKNNCDIYIPNAFTPNKDGLNDLFKPAVNLAFQKFSFIIFNRYGEKIFETYEYGKGWDGTYKGKEQQSGTYVYRITFTNSFGYESENNGTVLLIR